MNKEEMQSMMPAISKEKRADLVFNMVGTLMEQASRSMSDEEKVSFVPKVIDSIKT